MTVRGRGLHLAARQRLRSFGTCTKSFASSTTPNRSQAASVGHQAASTENEEAEMAQRLTDAKAEMIRMGYHGPSLWTQVICWGDHDQFQHVNNVHYLRFVESARIVFAEKAMGAKFSAQRRSDMLKGTGEGFILHSVSMRYKRPVVYPDTLIVGTKPLSPLSDDRFTLQSGLYSIAQQAIVTTSEHLNVCYDYKRLKKIAMPDDFREALEAVMGDVATP